MVHLSHAKKTYLWTVCVIVAFTILGAGLPKIWGGQDWSRNFELWGYPQWFRVLVGWVEVLGALALVWPRTSLFAAGALTVTMAGATYTQLIFEGIGSAIFPLILVILLASVLIIRWPHPTTETGKLDEPIEEDTDDDESPLVAR